MEELTQTADLKKFLVHAAKNGYANEATEKRKEEDGSETVELIEGLWRFNDKYFTSEDSRRFYGREIVFLGDKPYWFMSYMGEVEKGSDPGRIYTFLCWALKQPDENLPVRGPESFKQGSFSYIFFPSAYYLDRFTAQEVIYSNREAVYAAKFQGGLIN